MTTTQPLLDDEEVAGAWDQPDPESLESARQIGDECIVRALFGGHAQGRGACGHPGNPLKFLSTQGVEKTGEFVAEDDLVFAAFGESPILTFGSNQRNMEAETEWRARLSAKADFRWGRYRAPPSLQGQVVVESFVVTIRDAAASGPEGLIHPLLKLWHSKRCSFAVFALPAVQSVVMFKWATFAKRLMLAELAMFFVWLVAFYAFCAFINGEELSLPLLTLAMTTRGQFTLAAEAVALLAMLPFLILEVSTVFAYGVDWLRDPTNVLDMATYILQIAISGLHLGRCLLASRWLTYMLAVQCILLMFRLQYFTQVFRPTRFSFTSIIREVLLDVGWVLAFVFLTCVAFGAAFHVTFRAEKSAPEEFSSFIRSVLSSFEHIYGDLKLSDFIDSQDPIFATALALSFILIMGYILVNLLLGMIINSLDRVLQHEGSKQLCNQARVINELEALLPAWFEARKRREWHPAYVHVLRINPHKLDAVQLDKLWTKHGGDMPPVMSRRNGGAEASQGEGSGGEAAGGGGDGEAVDQRLAALENKLDYVQQTLESLARELLPQKGVQR